MHENSVEEVEIISTADSNITLQHSSTKAETISTLDERGTKSSKTNNDYQKYSLIYPENTSEISLLYGNDQVQCITGNVIHNVDDEMLRRYLQDTVQYNDNREVSDSSQEVHDHFLFSNTTEVRSECDEPVNYEIMDDSVAEDYVGHEVGVPDNLTTGINEEDEDFNSSDSFASTESIIPKKISCPKCPKKFMFKADLKRHDKYKHLRIIEAYFCKFCKRKFFKKKHLKNHELTHLKKRKMYLCQKCFKSFRNAACLNNHLSKCNGTGTPLSQ